MGINFMLQLLGFIGFLSTIYGDINDDDEISKGIDSSKPKYDEITKDDDFYGETKDGYIKHPDIKLKYYVLNRESYPIKDAPYSNELISPSKVYYKIPFYDANSVILTLRNLGEYTFKIKSLNGYLHAAHNFNYYIQNYTYRNIDVELLPKSEMSFEYQFIIDDWLPSVDYVFSSDIKYVLPTDTKDIEYNWKYSNITISVFNSSKKIDVQLLFMFILILIFWLSLFVLFYELYYIPNQQQSGNQPITTMELLTIIKDIIQFKTNISSLIEIFTNKDKDKKGNTKKYINNKSNKYKSSSNNNNTKSNDDDWLSGTSLAKSKSKKRKNKKSSKTRNN